MAIAAVALLAGTAGAAVLVYEGFNYGPAGTDQVTSGDNYNLLHGQPDGVGSDTDATGLSGTWQDSAGPGVDTDLFMNSGSLAFSNMATTGNHVASDTNGNNDTFSRAVTADLDGSGELWFGFLANKLRNDYNAAEGGLVIGNQTVGNSKILENTGGDGLQGFGIAPTTAGNDWTFYGWDGTSKVTGDAAVSVTVGGSDVRYLVGKISFNTGIGGADEFSFFDTTDDGDLGIDDFVQIGSTMLVDVDETSLNTLNLTRQVNTAYDEIRFGQSATDVIPEPATLVFLGIAGIGVLLRRRLRHLGS